MSTSAANRGKQAESAVRRYLEGLNTSRSAAFYRLPDAKAGSLQVTLSDFLLMLSGQIYLIEVKQVNHKFRLPHGNFDKAQVARQRIWREAGARSVAVIYHTPLNLWRGYNIDRFIAREGGSWDLSDTEPDTLENIMGKLCSQS
jgi:hypothetical protein